LLSLRFGAPTPTLRIEEGNNFRRTFVKPPAAVPHSEHLVQLFDAARSRADAAAKFLAEGWAAGDDLLVLAKPAHWDLIADYLERHGCPARDATSRTRLHFIDAVATLRRMRRRGVFVRDAALEIIGELVEQTTAPGRPLRAYGELVDLLAEEGSFDEACVVEDAWNATLAVRPARLLCGYSAAHFTDPRHATHLRNICGRHATVQTHSADALGSWLSATAAERA
jgi:hypothetical protein